MSTEKNITNIKNGVKQRSIADGTALNTGGVRVFTSRYRRCFKCEKQPDCTAMCEDLLVDMIRGIDARKEARKEYALTAYTNAKTRRERVRKWKSRRH